MTKISCTQHASNEQIYKDESCFLLETLKKRQKDWIGRVLKHDSLLQKLIEGRLKEKKISGRKRAISLDVMMHMNE